MMQTERVTFLTTPENKAALDAFASSHGTSVGQILREAATRYMAQEKDEEAELAALVEEANRAIPKMNETLDRMIAKLDETHEEVDRLLREAGIRK